VDENLRRKNRRAFLLLAAIFLGTPLAAFVAFRYTDLGKGATVNRGRLIEPPQALEVGTLPRVGGEAITWRDAWTMVRVEEAACGEACRADLHTSHQVWLLTNRDQVRVRRALISGAADADHAALTTLEPELAVLDARDPGVAAVAARLRAGDAAAGLYLIDPFGNLMMTYPSPLDPKGLQADLKRLLKLSEPWMRKP
jgi:hypothetical protein